MTNAPNTNFGDRLRSAAEARRAVVARCAGMPAADDPAHLARRAEVVAGREARAAEAAAVAAERARVDAAAAASREADRKAARDARYAARKARKAG